MSEALQKLQYKNKKQYQKSKAALSALCLKNYSRDVSFKSHLYQKKLLGSFRSIFITT